MTKIYKVQMNSKGAPDFSTAVEIPSSDNHDWEKYSDKLWKLAYEKGRESVRPQGKWIKDKSKNIWNMVVDCYKCSNCGKKAIDHSLILDTAGLNFCPNCGADMRKGEDDEVR